MKAKLKSTSLNFDYYNKYDIKIDAIHSVEATISANVYKIHQKLDCHDIEIQDTETTFYVNGKKTRHDGFRQLYINLYGETEYSDLITKIEKTVATKFSSEIVEMNLVSRASDAKLKMYVRELLKDVKSFPTKTTIIYAETHDTNITYSSNYLVQRLIKLINPSLIIKHDCEQSSSTHKSLHNLSIVDQFI
jgi:hypothetical protein|tara:strand:- start:1797 stop:2369 length:573 start_codon:yes stop_codon:yes gene_type:complete